MDGPDAHDARTATHAAAWPGGCCVAKLAEVAPSPSRTRRRVVTAIIVLLLFLPLVPWATIRFQTSDHVGPVDGAFDHADAALVLGARVYPGGYASPFLRERVAAGVELYKAGVVDVLIMSGDGNDSSGFGEPTIMRQVAEQMGVPAEAIIEDPHGVDTYTSCVRARDVFDVESVIVTTQKFHAPRATWLCERSGLDVQGAYPPVRFRKATVAGNFREIPAAIKAWLDVARGEQASG